MMIFHPDIYQCARTDTDRAAQEDRCLSLMPNPKRSGRSQRSGPLFGQNLACQTAIPGLRCRPTVPKKTHGSSDHAHWWHQSRSEVRNTKRVKQHERGCCFDAIKRSRLEAITPLQTNTQHAAALDFTVKPTAQFDEPSIAAEHCIGDCETESNCVWSPALADRPETGASTQKRQTKMPIRENQVFAGAV